nr:MFS transporter [Nocardiopsis akebiae]
MLPSIASDVDVSEAAAGQLVTVCSLVYALTAPPWAVLLARVSRRRALFWALAVFTAANVAVPLVDGYLPLVALRVVAALAAAVVPPASLAIAGTQAPPEHRGRHLATVMTGLTGAILIGVPLGTWIGAPPGWQATFVFGGLLGLARLALAARALPAGTEGSDQECRALADLVRPLANRTVAANLALQTYIAVVLSGLSGVTPALLAVLPACSGVGGLLGTQASGRLVEPFRAFLCAVVPFCLTMSAMAPLWLAAPVPAWAVVPRSWSGQPPRGRCRRACRRSCSTGRVHAPPSRPWRCTAVRCTPGRPWAECSAARRSRWAPAWSRPPPLRPPGSVSCSAR